ncbi:DNA-3-methyladenine glycosylase II [Sinobaca qinghaiensis]|uniref:DNA-3-methyladenine glycosylase II n=1 Tax=Sinobaca qinghaiensis TaxID=342944 RepID=A0A419UZF4_9BACL|nr:DNA-3-methyladenine glycosylase [Sinobaca qinghaiensis]RKD71063.1 DNA-3-methyladenine glycosylase II [Sinobaca qinghaiensis]
MNQWVYEAAIEPVYNYKRMLQRTGADPVHFVDQHNNRILFPYKEEGRQEVLDISFQTVKNENWIMISGAAKKKDNAVEAVYKAFALNTALEHVARHFEGTELASLFETYKGVPLVREPELYGCLMKTIIHQQLNMAFAYTLSTRFVERYGERSDGAWFYPSPEKTASLSTADLMKLQFSRRKAEYVIDTSRQIAEGSLNLERMETETSEEVFKTLTALRGIGPWTAECFLLFGLGRLNLMPAKDVGIQNGLKKLLELESKPSEEEIRKKALRWAPYESYAALYLWLSTESVT